MSMLSTTKYRNSCLILAMFFALLLHGITYAQTILRVDGDDGLANGDGLTWPTAFKYLRDAIAVAKQNPGAEDLWVAATDPSNPYRPDRDAGEPFGTGDRAATFLLDFDNIQLLGGFLGDETDPADRDPALNITVLSGVITPFDPPDPPCEDPNVGDCFTVTPEIPGCDNLCNGEPCPGCCALVCADDPICCILEWDQLCAGGGCPPNS